MKRRIIFTWIIAGWTLLAPAQSSVDNARRYDAFFLDAICQREKGNNDAAFDLFRHCIDIDSTRSEAYYYLSQYYAALKQKDISLKYCQRAVELEPDNVTYLETLANNYLNQRKYPEAINALEKLCEKSRDRDDVLGFLIQLYEQQGDYDNAICALRFEGSSFNTLS